MLIKRTDIRRIRETFVLMLLDLLEGGNNHLRFSVLNLKLV